MAGANTTLEVLIVEDTLSMALMYQQHLKRAGIKSHICQSGTLALTELRKGHVETVLLDLQLPDMNGLDLIKEMEGTDHNISFIVITANGSVNAAVDAMRAGAYDFLIKPFPTEKLLTTVKNALDRPKIKAKGKVLKTSLAKIEAPGFVGESKPMLEVYNMIENVANSNAAVFITGESGTGKEVTAQAIHKVSLRRDAPFIALNCAALPNVLGVIGQRMLMFVLFVRPIETLWWKLQRNDSEKIFSIDWMFYQSNFRHYRTGEKTSYFWLKVSWKPMRLKKANTSNQSPLKRKH